MKRGDLYVAYGDQPLPKRLFIEVRRVAKDGSWADIAICNWACMWTKRQPLPMKYAELCYWDTDDLDRQLAERDA